MSTSVLQTKQYILDKYFELPKDVFVTLMKSLDTDTFYDVLQAIKTKKTIEEQNRIRESVTTYYCNFKLHDLYDDEDNVIGKHIVKSKVKFGMPWDSRDGKPIVFEIRGAVRPAHDTVWIVADLHDKNEDNFENFWYNAEAFDTPKEAYESLKDGYRYDFYSLVRDRNDDHKNVEKRLLDTECYLGRFVIFSATLP